jgi:hypothetical protein
MDLRRTATIAVIGAAIAVWLAAAATSGIRDQPPPVAAVAPQSIDLSGAALSDEIKRLHERLRPTAAPRQPARNLFEFTAPKVKPAPLALPSPHAAEDGLAAVAAPPALTLSGLAEDPAPDGTIVRTAIISTPGQLFLAKEGDLVTTRYRVAHISPDGVELLDLTDNTTLRLVLK